VLGIAERFAANGASVVMAAGRAGRLEGGVHH
jgi:hypothetical protein